MLIRELTYSEMKVLLGHENEFVRTKNIKEGKYLIRSKSGCIISIVKSDISANDGYIIIPPLMGRSLEVAINDEVTIEDKYNVQIGKNITIEIINSREGEIDCGKIELPELCTNNMYIRSGSILCRVISNVLDPIVNPVIHWELGKNVENKCTIKDNSENKVFNIDKINSIDLGIGGLSKQFDEIITRTLITRLCNEKTSQEFGLKHVKGIILYGPAGTGKTLIARVISNILNVKNPIFVSGAEMFDKFVGGT